MRHKILVLALLLIPLPAGAQLRNRANLDRLNQKLCGQVVDYTHNHGADRRIYSPILGMPRDLYVYLPPGYSPSNAYPLVVYLHMAFVDEHTLVGSNRLIELDQMIRQGAVPPVVVVGPDGVYSGENRMRAPHSMFVNGRGGRFEDHIMSEVIPFVTKTYSIRPERQAHALLGASAGGLGALTLALKHRDYFATVAALAPPANLRYFNSDGDYRLNFDPATYRWKETYDPTEVVGVFTFGLYRVRARTYMDPVFGGVPDIEAAIAANNPADLLINTNLKPGELAIYINYPGRDNWNFDAQVESFAWLAAQRGVAVELECDPKGRHSLSYFRANHQPAFLWLGGHLPGPCSLAADAPVRVTDPVGSLAR